ncbi:MAG: hypothetical protein AOA65_1470 [Candidatus Bathyarchaeota archaeon BA1]|nr:MAG: hypothetical protein AOA65_1470 [Candidatus Bathyarchaeota archaeon BA1]
MVVQRFQNAKEWVYTGFMGCEKIKVFVKKLTEKVRGVGGQ